ncbi:hypothetical protein DITRI_Ditri01bG0166500 [Diplodiscus trichospermus]
MWVHTHELIIECDSKNAVTWVLNSQQAPWRWKGVISQIETLKSQIPRWQLNHVFRECNETADGLAKAGVYRLNELVVVLSNDCCLPVGALESSLFLDGSGCTGLVPFLLYCWFFLNALKLAASGLPHRSLWDMASKYEAILQLQLGEVSAVVVSCPEIAKEIMKAHDIILKELVALIIKHSTLKTQKYNKTQKRLAN